MCGHGSSLVSAAACVPPLTALVFSPSAPFDKTANITFSLNADDENVSTAPSSGGSGGPWAVHPSPPSRPYTLQPNANLLEICYKDRIQQFDDDEEDDGQGSGESDGEDGTWQGSPLARGPCLGVPPGMR